MVLHEMFPDIVYKIDEVASNKTSIYRVHFEMDNKHHSGEGFSKTQAKQNACENALKTLLAEKLAKEQEADKIASEKDKSASSDEKDKDDAMDTDEPHETERKIPTDDFPWGKLAAFAMQKLMDSLAERPAPLEAPFAGGPRPPFTPVVGGAVGPYGGHQTFGPSHPNHVSFSNYSAAGAGPQLAAPGGGFQYQKDTSFQAKNPQTTVKALNTRATMPRKKFPENPLEYNPVALCHQTWPSIEPTFDSSKNAEGHPVHTANLTLEGFRFSALGKSKKEVKLQLSKAVISTLKGVKYPDGFTAQVMQA
uniref:DRBM domain-containing protein n=1 Tax=Cacopsylla melanoneura TaxID=428564 RepID=A0A8D8X3P1_9HEMI